MKMKKVLSIALCLCMVLSLLPSVALAATDYPNGWDANQAYADGDTITIGGTEYTYKGDATNNGADFTIMSDVYDIAALVGDFIYKAGEGYILYSHVQDAATAAVTLHGARAAGAILPCYGVYGDGDMSYTGVDTTVTLEGASTLSDTLSHKAGSTTFAGTGTLALEAGIPCDLSGAVIIGGGAQVTLGDGEQNDGSNKRASFYQLLTVASGAKLTITANTELMSGSIFGSAATPGGITVENGGTLENNGVIRMVTKEANVSNIPGGITGVGVVCFGTSNDATPYISAGGEWLASSGDKTSEALDLSTNTPTEKAVYTAGSGTILWEPASGNTPATLTFNNATISGGEDYSYSEAIILPATPVRVVFNGTNSIKVPYANDPYVFYCNAATTFDLSEGSSTTLKVNGNNSTGIHSTGAVTINGTGATLTINSSGGMDSTISASSQAVTLNGGTLAFNGSKGIEAGTITLNGVTVPAGSTLSMYESGSAAIIKYGAVSTINGEVVMPANRPYTADDFTHFTGSGTVKVGDTTYKMFGSEWVAYGGDVPDSGLDLSVLPPPSRPSTRREQTAPSSGSRR